MLSPESRAALLREADRLRTEISDLTAERDAARAANASTAEDARLLAEVESLKAQREAAYTERESAVNSTDDAIRRMEEALEAQAQATAQANAGEVAPVNTNDKAPEATSGLATSEPVRVDEPVAPKTDGPEITESASATKTQKGGIR